MKAIACSEVGVTILILLAMARAICTMNGYVTYNVQAAGSTYPTLSCSASPTAVMLGNTVAITAAGHSPEGRPLTYSWSASSGAISSHGNTATLYTSGATPGVTTVTCRVADNKGFAAYAKTTATIKARSQPTVSCSANPSIMNQGATATITAAGVSPQGVPLTYSYSTSAGSISGTSTTATLATSGASAGVITVTCSASQQGGGAASATTSVLLQSLTGEQALSNFQFTDSVGVNVHLSYLGTVYATNFPQIMQSMINLGVNHYRDGLSENAPTVQYENAESLGQAGIVGDWLMDIHDSASTIDSAYANAPDAVEAFEGPNEDDAQVGSAMTTFMQLLNDTVRGNPATAAMPILAPSFVDVASFNTQGNLNSLINFGNMHDYFGTFNPETGPWGASFYNCGKYGGIQFDTCLAQMVAVGEPVIATETGYPSGQGLSDAIIGRYELRTLFNSLSVGISRTYLYELIDDPSSLNYGLLTDSFSPRPGYTAIQNVMSLLKDASFALPGRFYYTIAGQTQNVNHLLLQKSNGTFYLAIWLGVQSADPQNPSTAYNITPQNVTSARPPPSVELQLMFLTIVET